MKSFSQFSEQAYIAREELIEAAVLRRGLSRLAQRGALKLGGKTAARLVPGAQQVLGAYYTADAIKRGDWTGAALSAASMLPGPLGYAALGAETARGFMQGDETPKPAPTAQQPAPGATPAPGAAPVPAAPVKTTVLAKKGGVEGDLDKATGKWTARKWSDAGKSRYQSLRGANQVKSDTARLAQNQSAMNSVASQLSANPLGTTASIKPIQAAGQQYGNVAFAKRRVTTPKISA